MPHHFIKALILQDKAVVFVIISNLIKFSIVYNYKIAEKYLYLMHN